MNIMILGSGMSGLILAEILRKQNPFDKIIIAGEKLLGQQGYGFDLGPRILYYTPKAERFLLDMGITDIPKEFKLGCVDKDNVIQTINNETLTKYAMKTKKEMSSSLMSQGRNSIKGWNINDIDLPYKLVKNNGGNIVTIRLDKTDIEEIISTYDKVYCTIPLFELNKIYGISRVFKNKEVLYILYDEEFQYLDYAYVYDISDKPYKRIGAFKDKTVYEFLDNDDRAYKFINENLNKRKILKEVVLRTEILESTIGIETFNGMILVGRHAKNNHSFRMDSIIEEFFDGE